MKSEVTVLVNSCDKYEDAWYPFFECLWHFAGELLYPVILNTETKTFHSSHYDVLTVNTPKVGRLFYREPTWSERLLNVLSHVETEFIFFLLEDYFLMERFDQDRFTSVINYMKANPDVGIVDIKPHWAESREEAEENKIKFRDTTDTFIERNKDTFNITCTPTVWRTDVLRALLRKHEDVWDFEYYSGIRAKKLGYKVVQFNTRYPTIYEYEFQIWTGMGITSGKWLPGNQAFFNSLGIDVNFERLGILDVSSAQEIKQKNRSNPIVIIKKIPRKIRKRITRHLSLR